MATRAQSRRPPGVIPNKTNLEKAEEATPTSFLGRIVKAIGETSHRLLQSIPVDTKRDNTNPVLAELFMWREIEKYAKGKYKVLAAQAKKDGVIDLPEDEEEGGTALTVGDHVLGESRYFVVTANVTNPVRRFSPDYLAQSMFESYQIPIIVTKEKIERAKVPSKSQVKVVIIERP